MEIQEICKEVHKTYINFSLCNMTLLFKSYKTTIKNCLCLNQNFLVFVLTGVLGSILSLSPSIGKHQIGATNVCFPIKIIFITICLSLAMMV